MKKLTDQHHLDLVPCPPFQIFTKFQAEYAQSTKCTFAADHFAPCEEKVNDGKVNHGKDCIKEL